MPNRPSPIDSIVCVVICLAILQGCGSISSRSMLDRKDIEEAKQYWNVYISEQQSSDVKFDDLHAHLKDISRDIAGGPGSSSVFSVFYLIDDVIELRIGYSQTKSTVEYFSIVEHRYWLKRKNGMVGDYVKDDPGNGYIWNW